MAQDTPPTCISHDSNHHVADIEVDPRPSSSAAASGMVYAIKGAAGDYINTLFTSDEHYTPEDDIASMPSSYRKLRKSRSMFTNRPATTIPEHSNLGKSSASANQLPLPANSYFRSNENVPPRRLKTPRSMSFLREFRDSIVPAFKSEDNANPFRSTNGFTGSGDGPKHHLRPKSSKFFRPKAPSQDRVLRKSMRDTSNSTSSLNGTTTKSGSLRYRARRASQGFKHKLKNLFGLGKDDSDDAGLPLQHITAQRSHIFGWGDLHHETDGELLGIPPADRGALSHVASGIPSFHAVPPYQQLRSRQGSMDSLCSDQRASDERSRVTSWSNSDTNTVITHNSCREERERKRLSIINENGAHMCSSSAQFATISEQSDSSTTSLCRPVQAAPATVDGHRIYSALMKRMGHPQQAHTSISEMQHRADDIVKLDTVPRRKSSLHLRRFGYDPRATIRYVFPESEADPDSPRADPQLCMEDRGSPSKHTQSTANREEGGQGHLASTSMNMNAGGVSAKDADNGTISASSREGPPPLVRTLSSRSSAFFGSPTKHLFRTQSPYRRALQDRMQTAPNEQLIRSPEFNPWMRSLSNLPNLPIRRSSTYGSDADIKLHYTESIYSTNTEDGPTTRHSILSVVEDLPRPKSTHGDVTIFVNPPGHNKRSSSLPPKQRVTSSSSSIEWKMWLSSNVSKLEGTTTQVDSNDFQHGLSSARFSGHVREHAQIDDEEEDQVPDRPETPSRIRENSAPPNLDHDDSDDDQPTPFDAGDRDTDIERPRLPFMDHFPTRISASNMVSPATCPKQATPNTSTGAFCRGPRERIAKSPFIQTQSKQL
ncbi:hypothetical protein EKO27_g7290 [Xylaria grammica]|uniref:Uncharacterized protein n=1 Tax=Xylaria grammica TaxID=363999 RepID=A0A439D026_9PEZI|nr:hypothetical protein EKO27_g7290 [Xylaria grammica]